MRWYQLTENTGINPQEALQKIISQAGHQHDGTWCFRLSDIEQQGLLQEFEAAKHAGLIQFKSPVDWYMPTISSGS